ncbi:MAG: hypothetical protein ACLQFR_23850 [Streptosporangiaceae bacterium]
MRLERASDPPRLSEHRRGGGGGRILLALAKLSAGWVAGQEQANAAMMIRTAPSGGIVFSVGTTDWPLALADPAIAKVTENVLRRLAHPSLLIHGPTCGEGQYIGEGEMVGAGQEVGWYLDGAQSASLGLAVSDWAITGGKWASESAGVYVTTRSGDDDGWLTVTATARDATGQTYFGSRTVRVAGTEEYLRRRIIRTLDAIAHPDEQGGALVDQHASESSLAERVIPVRLGWIQQHTEILVALVAQLEARWLADGRMADGALSADEK